MIDLSLLLLPARFTAFQRRISGIVHNIRERSSGSRHRHLDGALVDNACGQRNISQLSNFAEFAGTVGGGALCRNLIWVNIGVQGAGLHEQLACSA